MRRPAYAIAWHVEPAYERDVKRRSLAALARRAMRAEGVAKPSTLSIAVVDDETICELNRRFLGINAPTDVLSFPLDSPEDPHGSGESPLGEVIIAFPTAGHQAAEAGHSVDDELAHLLIHGVLHVLGYDHKLRADARRMRGREEELLGRVAH